MPEIEEPFFCWWAVDSTVINGNTEYIVTEVTAANGLPPGVDVFSAEAEQHSKYVFLRVKTQGVGQDMGRHSLALFMPSR